MGLLSVYDGSLRNEFEYPCFSTCIEDVRCLRINGKGKAHVVGEAIIHGSPVRSTIGALKYPSGSARIEGLRTLRINGKGKDKGARVSEAGIYCSPVRSTIGALKYPSN